MRTLRFVAIVATFLAPTIAFAQPDPAPAPGEGSGSAAPSDPEAAKIKELVDRELGRGLNDRAGKEAADRAAGEQAAQQGATPAEGGDITGSSGFMDTRLAFTLTNENMLVKPGETIPSVPGWRFGT